MNLAKRVAALEEQTGEKGVIILKHVYDRSPDEGSVAQRSPTREEIDDALARGYSVNGLLNWHCESEKFIPPGGDKK